MKHAIAILETALETMENNEPINRREGNFEQADLEHETAIDIRLSLSILNARLGYSPGATEEINIP